MNFSNRFAKLAAGAGVLALAAACSPDLNVTNPNAPDVARAIQSSSDVRQLIGSSYNTAYLSMQGCAGGFCEPDPGIATSVMGDVMTMAFGNFGARFNGQEPRLAYNNSSAAGDGHVASDPYDGIYGALGAANDGLKAIKRGIRVATGNAAPDETPQFKAFAWLVQGLTLGFESQVYDRGFVVTENTEGTATLVDYKVVRDSAMNAFDRAIAASGASQTWTIPVEFTPGMTLTAAKLNQMANTMAARTLAYNARTAAENTATDWARVLKYANAGISSGTPFNLQIQGDGGNQWFDLTKGYADLADGSWVRVDQRIIQEAASNAQPTEWTSTTPPPMAQIPDLRFSHGGANDGSANIEQAGADFWFEKSVPYNPARGVYFFSQWAHARYIDHSYYVDNPFLTIAPYVLVAENDLLIAEALIRTNGDLARAASLINKTRVGRGGLPPVSAATSKNELLGAIFYERDVELFDSGASQGWFDRRRIDPTVTYNGIAIGNIWAFKGGSNLQKGTPRHLPLPAKELETLGMKVYTYGGDSPNPIFPEM